MLELGRHKFLVPEPDGMRTFALQQRILPVAARVANVLLALTKTSEITDLVNADVMSVLPAALPHIGRIFSEMPPGELEGLTRELLRDAKFGEKEPTLPLFGSPGGDAFGAVMRGQTLNTWRLLWHALEVWYPDFFARVRELTAANDAKANQSAVSSTSPGSGQASVSS